MTLAFQTDKSASDYAGLAIMAERLGFDGVSVYNDFGFQPALFPLVVMARETSRLRLGAACLNPYLTHPVEIAGQVATLDQVSDGRAYFGLARGGWLDRVGVQQQRPLRRMEETIEVVERLLRGDDRGYAGEIFQLAPGTRLNFPVVRDRVDLLLGTWGPRGIRLAAKHATEVKIGGCANPEMVRTARERLDEACAEIGRDPHEVGLVAGAVTVVDEDAGSARARAQTEVAMYVDVVACLDSTLSISSELLRQLRERLAAGDHEAAGRLIPAELLHRFSISGTPVDVAEHAASLFDAGASRVEFGTPHGVVGDRGVELIGTQVLPRLRALL